MNDTPDIVERLHDAIALLRAELNRDRDAQEVMLDAGDEITRLRAADGKLRAALWDADGWFRDYERQHLAKNTDDGDKKAATNLHRANRCRDAVVSSAAQARDEGGAVEAKAREIDPEAFESAFSNIYRSRSARRETARARAEHLLAAINTAEGGAWLAQKEPAGGVSRLADSSSNAEGEAGAAGQVSSGSQGEGA